MRLGAAEVRFTGRAEGDLGHGGRWMPVHGLDSAVVERRRLVHPSPWSWLRQVHGDHVVTVTGPGHGAGEEGDGAVSRAPGAVLSILTADCAPVAFAGESGTIGVAHAGWRGIQAGVLQATVRSLRALGERGEIRALIGPCIHPGCYEFGAPELDELVRRYGPEVASVTSSGAPALDVPTAVRAALAEADVQRVESVGACTACDLRYFSHRARAETERQAMLVWIP